MQYVRVESYSETRPLEVDTESSKTAVYLRKNIDKVPNEEGEGTHWIYDELKLTKEQYQNYLDVSLVVDDNTDDAMFDLAQMVDENSQAIMELAEMLEEKEDE